jgi:hypothetical protein
MKLLIRLSRVKWQARNKAPRMVLSGRICDYLVGFDSIASVTQGKIDYCFTLFICFVFKLYRIVTVVLQINPSFLYHPHKKTQTKTKKVAKNQ